MHKKYFFSFYPTSGHNGGVLPANKNNIHLKEVYENNYNEMGFNGNSIR
jgi:hypothetical protein